MKSSTGFPSFADCREEEEDDDDDGVDDLDEHLLEKQASKSKSRAWEEAKSQLWLAGPMIGVSVLQYSLQLVSVMFVGHLGDLSLASASIATSLASVSGFSILLGLAGALETLCGQAYGSRQYHLLGIYLQRGILVLSLTAILISGLWFNMEKLLLDLQQDPDISAKAGEYARWLIPGIFAFGPLQAIVKFLQTQAVVMPMLMCSCITLLIHIALCFVFIFELELGNVGAALASSISNWINLLLLLLYIRFSKTCNKTWPSFSWEAFNDLKGFLMLAIPAMIMVCFEWWAFEVVLLVSGILPNPQLETSAFSICLNTLGVAFMIPVGLSAAVSTRVSNGLGAGCPTVAAFAVRVALSLASVEALLVASLLLSIRHLWGWAFSNDVEVVQRVAVMIPYVTFIAVMDAVQGVLSGIARGCGWQAFGAFANLGAYYIVGLPTAIILAFVLHLGGQGLLIGIMCGVSTQMILLLAITIKLNWETQVEKAAARVSMAPCATLP